MEFSHFIITLTKEVMPLTICLLVCQDYTQKKNKISTKLEKWSEPRINPSDL